MQSLTLKIKGLYTHASELSSVPDGALSVADNIVIDRESVASPRRGFDQQTYGFSDAAYRANKVFFYQDKILAHYYTNLMAWYDTGAGWTNFSGTYAVPATNTPVRAAQANKNMYFTTGAGVKKLDAYNGTPVSAGAYKALDITASISASSSTWLTTAYTTCYRLLWGYRDANNNLILGAPSQREQITNNSGVTKAIDVRVTIPSGVTTSWFYQLYRAAAVTGADPSDEMGLVYEGNPTSGEISAGYLTITDITPDVLRGATLYTSSSQEGLAAQNERPPMCKDIAVYKNHMFFANTTSKHRYYLTLLAAGGTSGLVVDNTVTLGGIAYTAKLVETAASAQFRVYLSGSFTFVAADVDTGADTITEANHGMQDGDVVTLTNSGGALPTGLSLATTYYVVSAATNTFKLSLNKGGTAVDITGTGSGTQTVTYGNSASQNIRDTALSLVRVINQYSSSTVYAYYLSGPDDLPGKILLEERSLGGASFAAISSNTTCWNPSLPTSGTAESSTNDRYKNAIYYSKASQPESSPLTNFFFAGSADKEILRILPLRDSLFILKEDGIYKLSGSDSSSFRVDQFDATTRLIGPETAVVLNNQIMALTDQGVVAISDSGVQVKSRPIEYTLLSLQGVSLDNLKNYSFAVAYESERKYLLFVPELSGDTTATQCYVYNTFTDSWVRWTIENTCGGVNPYDDKLYLGDADSNYVLSERKTYTYTDHVDYGFSSTISVVSTTSLTMTGTDNIDVGDIIYQSSTVFATVTAVNSTTNVVTVSVDAGFTAAAATVYKAISSAVAWVPFTLGNPGMQKQFREATILFKQDFTGDASLVFTSDVSVDEEIEELTGTELGLWGLFGWGEVPWGGVLIRRPIRLYVPLNKQRCSQLTVEFRHATGYGDYQLNGISLIANQMGERVGNRS